MVVSRLLGRHWLNAESVGDVGDVSAGDSRTGRRRSADAINGPVQVIAAASVVARVEHLEGEADASEARVVAGDAAADQVRLGPHQRRVVTDDASARRPPKAIHVVAVHEGDFIVPALDLRDPVGASQRHRRPLNGQVLTHHKAP